MKKTLIAGVVLIAITTLAGWATAHARPAHVSLPDTMMGHWCSNGDPNADPNIFIRAEECNHFLNIQHDVYDGDVYDGGDWWCQIKAVRRVTSSAFAVHARCGGTDENQWTSDLLFQAIDNQLYVSGCAHNQCPDPAIIYLIKQWYDLNEICRGYPSEHGDSCEKRDNEVGPALDAHGYCYGKEDQVEVEREWHKCTQTSLPYRP